MSNYSSPDLTREIAALEREAAKQQPSDILQFCANFFHRRLESQRHEFLLGQRHQSGSGFMSESTFPGGNPFGGVGGGAPAVQDVGPTGGVAGGRDRAMQSVMEEEEHDFASPTASRFPQGVQDTAPSSNGGAFSGFAGFGGASNNNAHQQDPDPSATMSNSQQNDGGLLAPSSYPSNYNMNRRTSVSAESLAPAAADDDSWKPPHHPKTPDQIHRLRQAVSHNFLFSHLDDDQANQVLGALQERKVPAKDVRVIVQGDAGDYFYVVESGGFNIYVNKAGKVEPGPDGMGTLVGQSGPGQSFGELALMYNAPRAATVVSNTPSILWQLDRITFRRILMDSAFQRRRMYESFLEEVPLLASLTPYERSKIADALDTQKYPAGSTIIREGDVGDKFYLLESGEADVVAKGRNVKRCKKGDYFGELALMNDEPRAATIVSTTEVKVATLGKDGFNRLLGPLKEIMRRDDPRKLSG